MVSIPAGFSDALRPESGLLTKRNEVVSIPAGFSDALRLHIQRAQQAAQTLFQSLLGFLMRCDPACAYCIAEYPVSIPAGFSDALRLNNQPIHRLYHSFNPCWVF